MNTMNHRIITSSNPDFEGLYALQMQRRAKREQDEWKVRIKLMGAADDRPLRKASRIPKDRLLELLTDILAASDEPMSGAELLDALATMGEPPITLRTLNRSLQAHADRGLIRRSFRPRVGKIGKTRVQVYSLEDAA